MPPGGQRALALILLAALLTMAGLLLVLTGLWPLVARHIYREEVCWLSVDEIGASEPAIAFHKNVEISPPVVRVFNSNTLAVSLRVVMAIEADAEPEHLGWESPEECLELIREHETAVMLSLSLNFSLPERGRIIEVAQASEALALYTFIPTCVPGDAPGDIELVLEETLAVIWRSGDRVLWFDAVEGTDTLVLPRSSAERPPFHGGIGAEWFLPARASVPDGPQRWELVVGLGYDARGAGWLKGELAVDLELKIKVGFFKRVVLGIPAGPCSGMAIPEAPSAMEEMR